MHTPKTSASDKQEILDHFGGVVETAKTFNISKGAVSKWPDDRPVPENIAFLAERMSGGELTYDQNVYNRKGLPSIKAFAELVIRRLKG